MNDATPAPEPLAPTDPADPKDPVRPQDAHEPAGAAPLGIGTRPTGHPGVDAHLARLAEADDLPADGHPRVYEDVHRGLRAELTSLDAQPTPRSHDHRS
ncbi:MULTISPECIES: hypothetical protein [unclassified Streptomyces]|uniref:hypothetical protein n=1 Tax=unclassified Streptomyces TaxID=2593676 RepID=UPI00166048C6|nr:MULTISPECIES: hypothetical protein [unclassified Streptomyces]MBD0709363.1 hypothetical protein [Streptomyces sp. CBMA291]MBD0718238.1 hypothetical protein [Streptomyces sp. CBMA370]